MPFQNASSSEPSSLPQFDGICTLRVLRIEDIEDGRYGPRCRWVFAVADAGGDVTWENGDTYEWWQVSSTSMGIKSTGRPWAEALLGRALHENESGVDIATALIGCTASAVITLNDAGYPRIAAMTPIRKEPRVARVVRAQGSAGEDLPF